MIPVLVLSHGNLAEEILTAARTIDPHLEGTVEALSLPWDVDSDVATAQLRSKLQEMDRGDGVLVLTDMFGGTATNVALPFLETEGIEVVTGVNLPMMLKLTSLRGREQTLHEMAVRLMEAGQKSIRVASEYLRARRNGAARTGGSSR